MAGNCPWWLMESDSVVFSKCAKALSGTALLEAEPEGAVDAPPLLEAVVEAFAESALTGGARLLADGVYIAEVVRALEPAEDAPEDAKDVEAPVPVAPDDALD